MRLFSINLAIYIILELSYFFLKIIVDKNRSIDITNEREIDIIINDDKIIVKDGRNFSYNFCTRELTKRDIVSYSDYIKLVHEYCHAIHNEITKYKLCKPFSLLMSFLVLSTLVFFASFLSTNKVIAILAFVCILIYILQYLFVIYIEISANIILLKYKNIRKDSLVVFYIILNMIKEFVFRFLWVIVLYSVIKNLL